MTYCLGIVLEAGVVMASDSRSNAGVDQVAHVRKQTLIAKPGERVISILSAGNLATSQAVVTQIVQAAGSGREGDDIESASTLFQAARMIGLRLREVEARDRRFVKPYGAADASFLVGGQIRGEPPRLFQVYQAGNFIEATPRSCFLQIGETKYGKPILDRTITFESPLEKAAKVALLSFDATMRSNLSVGPPIDMMVHAAGGFLAPKLTTFEETDPYWLALRLAYGEGLTALVERLPSPFESPR